MKPTYSQSAMNERRKIARWRMAGIGVEVIAEKLGRHRSTVFRELNAIRSRIGRCRISTADGECDGT